MKNRYESSFEHKLTNSTYFHINQSEGLVILSHFILDDQRDTMCWQNKSNQQNLHMSE